MSLEYIRLPSSVSDERRRAVGRSPSLMRNTTQRPLTYCHCHLPPSCPEGSYFQTKTAGENSSLMSTRHMEKKLGTLISTVHACMRFVLIWEEGSLTFLTKFISFFFFFFTIFSKSCFSFGEAAPRHHEGSRNI